MASKKEPPSYIPPDSGRADFLQPPRQPVLIAPWRQQQKQWIKTGKRITITMTADIHILNI